MATPIIHALFGLLYSAAVIIGTFGHDEGEKCLVGLNKLFFKFSLEIDALILINSIHNALDSAYNA